MCVIALMGTIRPTGDAAWLGTKPHIIKLWNYVPNDLDLADAVEWWLLELGVKDVGVNHMLLDGSEFIRDNGDVIGIGLMETDWVDFTNE
jgi:hypothetical protein